MKIRRLLRNPVWWVAAFCVVFLLLMSNKTTADYLGQNVLWPLDRLVNHPRGLAE